MATNNTTTPIPNAEGSVAANKGDTPATTPGDTQASNTGDPVKPTTTISSSTNSNLTSATSTDSTSKSSKSSKSKPPKSTSTTPDSGARGQVAADATSNNTTISPPNSKGSLDAGQVAGIAVGAAIGAAIIAILATFLVMRLLDKKRHGRKALQTPRNQEVVENESSDLHDRSLETKTAIGGITPFSTGPLDDYLPQPADDKTMHAKSSTFFDQIQFFVENFCRARPNGKPTASSLASFDVAELPKPMSVLLPQARDPSPLIKSSLAHFVLSSITTGAPSNTTLLPVEFAALPATLANSSSGKKAGFEKCFSSWRVLSAHLRPNPSSDTTYQMDRDSKISDMVQRFQQAFSPWLKAEDRESSQTRTLTAIFREAAVLGVFLFSQPFDLQFHWPTATELNPGKIAITPALVKLTDEHGQRLPQKQVLTSAETVKI